jgi:hypothetical protein
MTPLDPPLNQFAVLSDTPATRLGRKPGARGR